MVFPGRVASSVDVLFHEAEDGESVLLNLQSEQYFPLDDIGTRVWQLPAATPDFSVVMTHFLDEYDLDEATLRQDMVALLNKMAAAGLVNLEG